MILQSLGLVSLLQNIGYEGIFPLTLILLRYCISSLSKEVWNTGEGRDKANPAVLAERHFGCTKRG